MADFDKQIAEALENDEAFIGLKKKLLDAASKTIHIRDDKPCTKCSCKHIRMVEVPDYATMLKIMEWASNRGVGRPSQADGGSDAEKITFIREVRK